MSYLDTLLEISLLSDQSHHHRCRQSLHYHEYSLQSADWKYSFLYSSSFVAVVAVAVVVVVHLVLFSLPRHLALFPTSVEREHKILHHSC
jgi:hypothetical protein